MLLGAVSGQYLLEHRADHMLDARTPVRVQVIRMNSANPV
jgi:hypothetical protein